MTCIAGYYLDVVLEILSAYGIFLKRLQNIYNILVSARTIEQQPGIRTSKIISGFYGYCQKKFPQNNYLNNHFILHTKCSRH